MLKLIDFETIYPIWKNNLWPNRTSDITSNSAMVYLGGYDIKNMYCEPTFLAFYLDNKIVGVNSGHICADNSFRSRGLYVFPEYRKQGIGTKLLFKVIDLAKENSCSFVWSYPKLESWTTYQQAGFKLSSEWENSELGLNAYCIKDLN
jgi:GNAT superfamily N-acetyltransferase